MWTNDHVCTIKSITNIKVLVMLNLSATYTTPLYLMVTLFLLSLVQYPYRHRARCHVIARRVISYGQVIFHFFIEETGKTKVLCLNPGVTLTYGEELLLFSFVINIFLSINRS